MSILSYEEIFMSRNTVQENREGLEQEIPRRTTWFSRPTGKIGGGICTVLVGKNYGGPTYHAPKHAWMDAHTD